MFLDYQATTFGRKPSVGAQIRLLYFSVQLDFAWSAKTKTHPNVIGR